MVNIVAVLGFPKTLAIKKGRLMLPDHGLSNREDAETSQAFLQHASMTNDSYISRATDSANFSQLLILKVLDFSILLLIILICKKLHSVDMSIDFRNVRKLSSVLMSTFASLWRHWQRWITTAALHI